MSTDLKVPVKCRLGILFVVIVVVASVTACAKSSAGHTGSESRRLSMSWAEAYSSVAEMTKYADAVVMGKRGKVLSITSQDDIPYTDFQYDVQAWLVGASGGTRIVIHQTGAAPSEGRQSIEADGDPLLRSGEQSLLFLKKYATGKYFIMGGPTGRILNVNGQLTPLPGGHARDGLPAPVKTFAARLAVIARSVGK